MRESAMAAEQGASNGALEMQHQDEDEDEDERNEDGIPKRARLVCRFCFVFVFLSTTVVGCCWLYLCSGMLCSHVGLRLAVVVVCSTLPWFCIPTAT